MSSIGIVINVYTDKENTTSLHKCSDISECKIIIIQKISEILNKENLDFPVSYEEFKSSWMEIFGTFDAYTYHIFMNNEWVTLWTEEELYDEIYDYMLKIQEPVLNANGTLNEYDIESENDDDISITNERNIDDNMEY